MVTNLVKASIYSFNCSSQVPAKQDTLWLLRQGVVKTYTWNEEGNLVTLGYWGSGDIIGRPLSVIYPYEIKCLTDVEAEQVPCTYFNYWGEAIRSYAQRTEELLFILRSENIYQRLYKTLIWLATKFGIAVESGRLIDVKITHQELAETVGATRVTVTRLLGQLEQEGLIERSGRCFIVR